MSDDDKTNEKLNQSKNGPSYHALHAKEGKEGKSYYNRVGVAFAHKDGKGHNIMLDSVPVDGKIVLRTPQARVQAMKEGSGKQRPAQSRERD